MREGFGAFSNPLPLESALNYALIQAGQTLYIRGGIYTGDFISYLTGTAEQPITIQPYNNERVTIDGAFSSNGADVVFMGLEITYLGWATRLSEYAWSNPPDIPYEKSLFINNRSRYINCIFHDLAGIGLWSPATGSVLYGTLIYNIGWMGSDRGHGHSVYTQNVTGRKKIKHNIMLNNFGWGIHAYSTNGVNLQGFDLVENTLFNAGNLAGSNRPNILIGADSVKAADINITGNKTLGGPVGIQFYGAGAEHVTIVDNYCPDGVNDVYTADVERGNYWGPSLGNRTFLHPNEYDPNRAHLTIYNEAEVESILVDVSSVYTDGNMVRVHNAQDYYDDIQTLEVVNGSITVDMRAVNRTVSTPYGGASPATTFPQFGCFVLES